MGLIDSAFAAMRPWTRRECARLVNEAGERIATTDSQVGEMYRQLQSEFTPELDPASTEPQARIESVYTRVGHISGMPLNDGYHFAETQINDFGRPFGEGWNTSTGFSFYTTAGPWTGYFRGELQSAPSVPALSLSARQFIAAAEDKWRRLSGITLLLPHGFEGMGPEHSSARLERFLELAAEDNIQVVQPTTPAQYFHILRRQAMSETGRPLILMQPKSLLRLPAAASKLDDLATRQFQPVLNDDVASKAPLAVDCCSCVILAIYAPRRHALADLTISVAGEDRREDSADVRSSSSARALSAITSKAPASSMTSFSTSRPPPDR